MAGLNAKSVNLTPQLESWVDGLVASGEYRSASEVVREALRGLKEDKDRRAAELEAIRTEIREGVEQLKRGEGISGPPRVVMNEIRERVKRSARS